MPRIRVIRQVRLRLNDGGQVIRRTGQVLAIFIVMITACLLLLAVLPGSWIARQAAPMASSYLELPVEMVSLNVRPFSLTPSATINTLQIRQSPESARIHATEVTASLSLSALFRGEFLLERLRIIDGGLEAGIDEQGHGNWHSSDAGAVTGISSLLQSVLSVRIDDLVLDSFNVHLVNAQLDTELSLNVEGMASTYDPSKKSRGHVEGYANEQPVVADAEFAFLGDVLKLTSSGNAPISIDATAAVGDDRLSLNAAVGNPASMGNVKAVFSASISSLEHWQAFFPMRLPDLPSFSLAGELTRDKADWLLRDVDVRFGNTDISGEVRVDTSRRPMKLDARLTSEKLAVDEFMPLRGIALLPMPFNGRIDFRAEQVVSDSWPVDDVDLVAVLDDRQLSLFINRISLRNGELDGEIVRELYTQPVLMRFGLNLKRLDLQQLLPADNGGRPRTGQMAARIELNTAGNTLASMLSSADGVVVTLMTGDWLDTVLETVLGAELAGSLMVDRGVPDQAGQKCAFLELQATEGIVQFRSLVLDTDTIVYLGDGELDWKNQLIDLTIEPHFKKVQAGAVAGALVAADGVYVSGPLSAPVVESVHPFLNRDTAVSVLDATITPTVALMPFLNEHSDGSGVACQGIASSLDNTQ